MGAAHLSTQTTIPFTLPGRYWWPEHLALARQSDPLVSLEGHWQIWSSEEKMKELWKKTHEELQIYQTNKWNPMNHTIRWTIWSIFTWSFIHKFLKAKDQALADLGSQPIPGPGFGSCTRAGIEGWQLEHSNTSPGVDVNIQGWEVPLMAMIVWLAITILYIYIYMYICYICMTTTVEKCITVAWCFTHMTHMSWVGVFRCAKVAGTFLPNGW